MKLMEAIKKVFSVFSVLEKEEKRAIEVEQEVHDIIMMNGEGLWIIRRPQNLEDCVDECNSTFSK